MIKTYIAALLVALLAGTQVVQAQESMDDVFAQLDSASETSAAEAPAETAPAETVAVAPAPVDSSVEVVAADAEPVNTVDDSALFKRGQEYYKNGDYDNAAAIFEAMLALDPYDTRAMTHLQRTVQRIGALEVRKQVPSRVGAMAEVEAAWNPTPKVRIEGVEKATIEVVDPDAAAIAEMEAHIKGIMIPSLDFRDANIKDVSLFLSETCRRLDPAGKGVNMLLLGMNSSYDADASNVTISIRDMSLFDALMYIVEMAELKFEVKPNAIAIMPVSYAPVTDFVLKSYDVSPDVGADMEAGAGGDDSGGGDDDLFGDSMAVESSSGPLDVTGFFSIIDFPEGANAIYQPRFQKLFVKNTPKNLASLENVLNDMEDEATAKRSQQVEIEAKFVEFNEGALEELGFDWTMFGSGSVAGLSMDPGRTDFANDSGLAGATGVAPANAAGDATGILYNDPVSGQSVIGDKEGRPGQNIFGNSSRRDNSTAFESVASGVLASMGGSPAAMVFGNSEIDLRITAMEQEGTADVLSAPRVTTKSGNEAILRVAEVHRYPQDWDVETGQRTSPVTKPQDWEDFDLGVSLKVTPVVDSESNTIDLDLHPEINKFKGFDQYKVGANAYESDGVGLDENGNVVYGSQILGDSSALIVSMPYFEKRSIQTQVTIADGHTVLMGGLVDERTETFRDQVPFLGDIPYLGRLFRSEGSRSAKKNLVIYVKATQVDDHGMTQADRDSARMAAGN